MKQKFRLPRPVSLDWRLCQHNAPIKRNTLYSSRYFVISRIARRQISARIRQNKYSSPNHSRRYLLSNLWIKFHVFPPFTANSRTTYVFASPCSGFLKASLCRRRCAAKSSNVSGSSPQTNLSVNFDIATVVRAATNADTTGFLSNFRVSDRLSSGKHVARFRGWSVRETQGTDVTKAGCPASQHTQ